MSTKMQEVNEFVCPSLSASVLRMYEMIRQRYNQIEAE